MKLRLLIQNDLKKRKTKLDVSICAGKICRRGLNCDRRPTFLVALVSYLDVNTACFFPVLNSKEI